MSCRVVAPLSGAQPTAIPATFVAVDASEELFAVAVLWLPQNAILNGHSLLIREPEIDCISVSQGTKEASRPFYAPA